ncbi:hypothetical protein Tco_0824992 [Tanacetum coccineum]
MMLDSIDEGPLVYPTVVGEDGQTRPKKYSELTKEQQLQDDCDAAKDIWDIVKLLMKGTELSYQDRECKLYNLFDKSASVQTSSSQYQVSECSSTGMEQVLTQQSQAEFPQLDSGLAVPTFQQGEDPIDCINKAMAFLSAVASRFPYSNNQLITSSNSKNSRNHSMMGYEVLELVRGKAIWPNTCTQPKRPRNSAWFKEKLLLFEAQEAGQILDEEQLACYKLKGKLCSWSTQEVGQILHEEQLAFIAALGIAEAQVAQQTIPKKLAFQTEDLDAYESDCDDISLTKVVLMANL